MLVPVTLPLHRRTVLKAGAAAGLAVAATPALARTAAAQTPTGVFRHGVASGDPLGTAVLLWTRVTPSDAASPGSGAGPAVDVVWEVAGDEAFTRIVRSGTVRTDAGRDHTVHADATGLAPYTRYFFRFRALGATSPVGRTQTAADDGRVHALRLGFVSCSNYTGGFFAAYRHLAQRRDLDAVVHLGDYIYEYGNTPEDDGGDRYGPPSLIGKRDHVPGVEMVTLADYRQRHANYKSDPDLQAAHAAVPWIVIFDDHEVTNDTFDTGAENHQPETEGDFLMRRRLAYQAYLEWMPIRLPDQGVPHRGTRFWRSFSFGPIADLFVVDTRQNRSQAVTQTAVAQLDSPDRVFMEPEQMAALKGFLAAGTAQWHLIGNQTVFTRVGVTPAVPGYDRLQEAFGIGATGSLVPGEPRFNPDQWDGYQDDQREVITAMAASPADPVVLTGDIHSSWANDIPQRFGEYVPAEPANNSIGVEFVCPSITSDGFTEVLGGEPQARAATTAFQGVNPWIRYLDGIGHGFAVIDVTPDRVQTDFWHLTTAAGTIAAAAREDPGAGIALAAAFQSVKGSRSISTAQGAVGARSDSPATVAAPPAAAPPAAGPPPAAPAAQPAAARAAAGRTLPATGGTAAAAAAALVAASAVGVRAARRSEEQESAS